MNRGYSIRAYTLGLLGLVMAGCSTTDLSRPSAISPLGDGSLRHGNAVQEHPYTIGSYQQSFQAATCTPHRATLSSGVFGPAGGTLFFGGSRLIIPGGALRDTVTISAVIPEGSSSRVDFAPNGLQFNKPAGLILSTDGCVLADPNVPDVVYLGEDGQVIETIPAVFDPHWKTIAAPIRHFSGYAIAF